MINPASANLDMLRSIAVLCVYLTHLSAALKIHNPASLGRFGVYLFFVHTSLVLMASLERLDRDGTHEGWRLSIMFWIRRLFRIYPLSIFCVLLIALFQIPTAPGESFIPMTGPQLLSNLTLMQPITLSPFSLAVMWSLPYEVEMYVLLPFIYFFVRSSRYRPILVWLLALAAGLTLSRLNWRLRMFDFAPCFAAGVLAFKLSGAVKAKLPAWIWPCAICLAILLFGPMDDTGFKLPRAWALSLALALLIPFMQELNAPRIEKIFHLIAKYSYGIYLSHSIVFWFALDWMTNAPVLFRYIVIALGSLAFPIAMFHLIEDPLIRIGSRISKKLAARQQSSPVVVSAA